MSDVCYEWWTLQYYGSILDGYFIIWTYDLIQSRPTSLPKLLNKKIERRPRKNTSRVEAHQVFTIGGAYSLVNN